MIGKPEKVKYEIKQVENDSEIDAKTTEEITEFLETFFKIYPTASAKELEYYVENDVMQPINSNLNFVELVSPIYQRKGDVIQTIVVVKYLNNTSKIMHNFEYNIILQEVENWKIIGIAY